MHFVKYKDQDLAVQIDFSVIKIVCSKLNIQLSSFEQVVNNPDQFLVVCHEALKRGHKLDGKEYQSDEKQTEEILNDCFADLLEIFTECVLRIFTPSGDKKKL